MVGVMMWQVEGESEASRKVSLVPSERLKVVDKQLVELVRLRQPAGLPLNNVTSSYLWYFKVPLKPSTYHCRTLDELFTKLPNLQVLLTHRSTKIFSLIF